MFRVTPHSFAPPVVNISPFASKYHITEYSSPAYVRAIEAIERIHQEQDIQKYNKKLVNAFKSLGFPPGKIMELIDEFKAKGIKTLKQQLEIAKELSEAINVDNLERKIVALPKNIKR